MGNILKEKVNNIKATSRQNLLAPVGLITLVIFFSIISPYFFTMDNGITIIRQASINIVIAVGMTLVIITAGIDLSVGAIAALSACTMSQLFHFGDIDIMTAMIIGILVGTLIGLLNGIVIQYGKIAPFIATLGTMGIARGLALIITTGSQAPGFPDTFRYIGKGEIGGIPFPFIIAIIILIIGAIILKYTEFGRSLYAIGGNEEAARLSGINIARVKIAAYTFAGFCAAVAGIILAARVNSAPPTAGQSYELDAIAAVVIGGASLMGGEGSVWGTLIGAILMAVLANGLNLLNVNTYVQIAVIGVVIILAVLFKNISNGR